jgi:YVTN family beta-propeller protein
VTVRFVLRTIVSWTITGFALLGGVATAGAHDPVAFLSVQPQEAVTMLDLATGAITSIPLGQRAWAFAFSPDGRTAYTAFGGGVKGIDVEAGRLLEDFGSEGWSKHIVVTPDGTKAFVDLDGSSWISVVELGGRRENAQIELGEQGVGAMAITPDGRTVFVYKPKRHEVYPVDVATRAAGAPIELGQGELESNSIAMSPDGRTVYVAGEPSSDAIVPIDVATRTAGSPIVLHAGQVDALAISPDSRTAYAVIPGGSVVPVDLGSGTAGAEIPVGKDPDSIAITPDGRTAYVANYESASVTPIDLTTRTAEAPLAVGNYPTALTIDAALTPAAAPPGVGVAPAPPASSHGSTLAGSRCLVPRLAHLKLGAIKARLRRNHCRLGRVRRRHGTRRKDYLIRQAIRPGRRLAANAKVGVVLSSGPRR